jgi:integrase
MARRIKAFGGQEQTLPIRDKRQLDRVMNYLIYKRDHSKSNIKEYQSYRNYMLFLIGFNTAFRAEDLLQLRVKDVYKGYVSIQENKTGKMQNFRMNKQLHDEILKYIETYKLKENEYLFMGQKKQDTYKGTTRKVIYPITRQNTRLIFKDVSNSCGIDFKFGLHSLRKTFGYMYVLNGGNIMTLMKMYNHDEPGTTMLYVMWNKEDAENERESIFIGGKK